MFGLESMSLDSCTPLSNGDFDNYIKCFSFISISTLLKWLSNISLHSDCEIDNKKWRDKRWNSFYFCFCSRIDLDASFVSLDRLFVRVLILPAFYNEVRLKSLSRRKRKKMHSVGGKTGTILLGVSSFI